MYREEKIPKYKPLPKNSKFKKPNNEGQVAIECVHFNFVGKHCYKTDIGEDCIVLKNKFCNCMVKGQYD